jgi:hypothetical protein
MGRKLVAVTLLVVSVSSCGSHAPSPIGTPSKALGPPCTPEMMAPVDALRERGDLRAAWDAASVPAPSCVLEMQRRRLEIAAELGDVSNAEAVAAETGPGDAEWVTHALATARMHAHATFADLLRDGLAARRRGAKRESRELLDRAAVSASRDSGGRLAVRAVLFPIDATWLSAHSANTPSWTLSDGESFLSEGDFAFELATGRVLYLPDLLAFSRDGRRVLRAGSIPLLTTSPPLKDDEQLVSLVELGTGRVLFEEPVTAEIRGTYPDSAYNDDLTEVAVPLLRDAPYVSLFEADGPFVRLPGGPPTKLETVSRPLGMMFGIRSLSGLALVRNQDAGTLWVSHDEDGDTVHLRRRGSEGVSLHERGARLRLLMPSDGRESAPGSALAVAWSDGVVELYDHGRRIARYTGMTPTIVDFNQHDGILAWADDTGVHAQLADGKRLTLDPEHRNGCGTIVELSVNRKGVSTSEESGDVDCGQQWDFRTNKSTVQWGASPADEYRDATELAALAKKVRVDASALFYRHSSALSLAKKNGTLTIVDSFSGREMRKLEGDGNCDLDTVQWTGGSVGCITLAGHLRVWDPKTGRAWPSLEGGDTCSSFTWNQAGTIVTCGDKAGGARVCDARTGRRLFESPPPAPAIPMSVARAEENVRCVIGAEVYPFALCESEARAAGFVE